MTVQTEELPAYDWMFQPSSSPQLNQLDISARLDELFTALRNRLVMGLNHPDTNATQMVTAVRSETRVVVSSFTIFSKHMNTILDTKESSC